MTALPKRKDEDLVLAAQNDCRDSFSELIKRHREKMYHLCLGIMRSHDEAEDVLGEVELLLFQNIKKFKCQSKYTSWAYRVTTNAALQRLRYVKRIQARLSLVADLPPPSFSTIPELRKQQQEALKKAVAALTDDERYIFMARYGKRIKFEIVAAKLGITVNGAKSRTWRVTEKLRYLLRDWNDY